MEAHKAYRDKNRNPMRPSEVPSAYPHQYNYPKLLHAPLLQVLLTMLKLHGLHPALRLLQMQQ